jgi:mono/diheme cytochrome c family protein
MIPELSTTLNRWTVENQDNRYMKIVLTILGCFVAAVIGGLAFIYSGTYDVSATTPDNAVVAWAVHTTSDRSVGARLAAIQAPPGLDQPAQIEAGGHLFAQNCAMCHGGPGLTPTAISKGLNPQPPNLFRATRKPDQAENFQFIKHGVKMTGMPAFGPTYPDKDIWSLVAFLNVLPGISPADFSAKTGMATTAKPAG